MAEQIKGETASLLRAIGLSTVICAKRVRGWLTLCSMFFPVQTYRSKVPRVGPRPGVRELHEGYLLTRPSEALAHEKISCSNYYIRSKVNSFGDLTTA